jgi:hypothetical protein
MRLLEGLMSRSTACLLVISLVLLLCSCAGDGGLLDSPAEWDEIGAAPDQPDVLTSAPGQVLYVHDDEDLAEGVRIAGDGPFRSFSLVVTAPVDSELSVRHPTPGGDMSPWRPAAIDEVLGVYRSGHELLPRAVEFAELRASSGASFLEVVLYEGVDPLDDDDPGDGTSEVDEDEGERDAENGRWTPPYATWLAGQEQYLPYSGASSCTGSLRPGARALGEFLVAEFGATSFGGYNCRTIGGSGSLSVHSEGRAIDVYVPMDGTGANAADNGLGDPIANWLIENAEYVGMSYVIWDRASWGAHRGGDKHRVYGGSHPHNNHLHIELTWAAAAQDTPWFTDPGGASTSSGDRYLVGDWDGDGRDNLAVRRGSEVYMDTNFDGLAEIVQAYGEGDGEDDYLVGDWAGQGHDRLAVRRGDTVLMDTNLDALADLQRVYGNGSSEDEYLVGDWDGDGDDDLAVRRGDTVYMDTDGDGLGDLVQMYGNGASEDEYLVGDWDGDGRDNLAVRRGDTVLMDTDFTGGADLTWVLGNGTSEDEYLVGDWDGDGIDDLAVRRDALILMDTDADGIADIAQLYGNG